ncbi:hypothetical protein ACJMK2_016511 [Sinanodonta woodiana]|uniref:Uncharacterized protein n=1 Tax=Sinanodonta woodiana TaxID=1069815 RepID=A0ABD3UTZ9_SINWO
MNVTCDECTKPCLPLLNTGSRCSEWSTWSNCSVTCGNGTQTRVRVCMAPNCTVKYEFDTIKCNVTPECQDPIFWSAWSSWSNCSVTCGNGTQTRVKICTGTNCTEKVQFNITKCNATPECQDPIFWSAWSSWSNCSVTCGNGTQTRVKTCTGSNCTDKVQFDIAKCNATPECQDPIFWSAWSSWSNCSVTCGNGTQTRVKTCTGSNCTDKVQFDITKCNATTECQEQSTQTNRQENVSDDAQNITKAHIAIAAIVCFLIGILVAALVSMFYMKRKQQGCLFYNNKSADVGSRMQSGPDIRSQSTRAKANEYEFTENKNENKTVETTYHSLNLDLISKDQQTYGGLEPEPLFQHCDNKPHSGHQNLTLSNGTAPFETENVYEYERDCQDNENVSRLCKSNCQGQKETDRVVYDTAMEVHCYNGNTDDVYSVLEPADNTRNMPVSQSDDDHNYFVLETVDKAEKVWSG